MKITIWNTDLIRHLDGDYECTRPAFIFVKLKPWIGAFFRGFGSVLKYGSIVALSGATFYFATADLRDGAWSEGCRAGLNGDICDYAARVGQQIRQIRAETMPGKLAPASEKKIASICGDLRTSVPLGVAAHYGCP